MEALYKLLASKHDLKFIWSSAASIQLKKLKFLPQIFCLITFMGQKTQIKNSITFPTLLITSIWNYKCSLIIAGLIYWINWWINSIYIGLFNSQTIIQLLFQMSTPWKQEEALQLLHYLDQVRMNSLLQTINSMELAIKLLCCPWQIVDLVKVFDFWYDVHNS